MAAGFTAVHSCDEFGTPPGDSPDIRLLMEKGKENILSGISSLIGSFCSSVWGHRYQ